MTSVKSWSDLLSEGGGEAPGVQKRMTVNLEKLVQDDITDHDMFLTAYEANGKFFVEYNDYRLSFAQKGWTIYIWELSKKEGVDEKAKFEKIRDGLAFRSDGVIETIKRVRAENDGVEYKKPKPQATELDPEQLIFEMEQFRKDLQSSLSNHPLFVTAYISHVYIFIIYYDVLFSVRPDDYGNYEYELLERMGDLETKLCKTGTTVGRGGVLDRIVQLRSAWDLTHDLTPELVEIIKKEHLGK